MRRFFNLLRTRPFFYELFGVIVIIAAFSIVVHHIASSEWKDFVFGNSDMLTLSLLWQSIGAHEPFSWVFSSQIFLFPEMPIYAISSIFSPNFKVTLIVNAFLNIVFVYCLLRIILQGLSKHRFINYLFSVSYTVGILLTMSIEARIGGNLAMFFFVTTAYYGVILSSLLGLGLILRLLKPTETTKKKQHILFSVYFIVTLLTGMSNPLFFLQFSAPIILVLLVSVITKVISKKVFLSTTILTIVPIGLSLVIRSLFLGSFFSPLGEVSSYLHLSKAALAIHTYIDIGKQMITGGINQEFEIIALSLLVIFALTAFAFVLRSRIYKKSGYHISNEGFVLITFAAIAPLTTVVGTILTGNPVMRYLLPVLFFTPLALIPFFINIVRSHIVPASVIFGVSSSVVIIIALLGAPLVSYSKVIDYYPSSAQCMDNSLINTPYTNGVAQYWRARMLQLNSRYGHRVVQTNGSLGQFNWLYNNSSYNMYNLSFVIVDKIDNNTNQEVSLSPAFTIAQSTVLRTLGKPDNIYDCPEFYIYGYGDSSPGRAILNQAVRDKSPGI